MILLLLAVVAATAWAGFAVRQRDPIASALLFLVSGAIAAGLVGAFFGWF